jgi:hypothetical protein
MSKDLDQKTLHSNISCINFKDEPISFPFKITPSTTYISQSATLQEHMLYMERSLREAIPKIFYEKSTFEFIEDLIDELPCMQWDISDSPSDTLTVYLLCETTKEEETEFTFLKILKKWLLPLSALP